MLNYNHWITEVVWYRWCSKHTAEGLEWPFSEASGTGCSGLSRASADVHGQSTNQSISQWMNEWMNESINQSINQSINHSINQSVNQSISQSVNQSVKSSICKAPLKQSSQRRLLWVGLRKEPSLKADLNCSWLTLLFLRWGGNVFQVLGAAMRKLHGP